MLLLRHPARPHLPAQARAVTDLSLNHSDVYIERPFNLIGICDRLISFPIPGVLTIGMFALGILSAGCFSIGVFAAWAISLGIISLGAIAIGDFSVGALAIGKFFALGDSARAMIAGNLLQQVYNLVNTLIVGKYIGADALASVGSAYTLMIFITSIIGLCMGSGAFFSGICRLLPDYFRFDLCICRRADAVFHRFW